MGKPQSKKTAANFAEIFTRLSLGESLRTICKSEHLPSIQTFCEWVAEDPALAEQYARARERQADYLAEEIIEIADDNSGDRVTLVNDEGEEYERIDHEHIQRSRLRVDARKWYASKLAPKRYGDKIQQEISGKDGGPAILQIVTKDDKR